ncbi:ParB N-terminal domain-containing protein [Thermococcus sp.]|uniref:ParB N-terminal domain-containing protein n=1 Tax=Thermococcus sp. TaxID=35749 RepID=UPI0025E4292C|nr:ParB N-terminal domain-containing protein [Thermococcus sp.]
MKKIRLISRDEAFKRAERIADEYRAIYGVEFTIEDRFVNLDDVIPTQGTVSEAKLLVVLQEIKHGYNAPIVVVPYGRRYYLLDGHHRAFALKNLGFGQVEALVLQPSTRFLPGVVKIAEKSGLGGIKDIKVVRD